jgi:hypothetical protein
VLLTVALLFGSLLVTYRMMVHFARVDTPLLLKCFVGISWFSGISG